MVNKYVGSFNGYLPPIILLGVIGEHGGRYWMSLLSNLFLNVLINENGMR